MFHWIAVIPNEEAEFFFPRVLQCLGCYFLGFFFFSTGIPERLDPGQFDYIFTSHQIWHMCVFFAAWSWGNTLFEFAHYRQSHVCNISTELDPILLEA